MMMTLGQSKSNTPPTHPDPIPLTRITRTPNIRPIPIPRDIRNLQHRINNATHPLARNGSRGNTITINIKVNRPPLCPKVGNQRANKHSISINGRWEDKRQAHGHKVWHKRPVLFPTADEIVVAEDDGEHREGAKADGEDAGAVGDREGRVRDGNGDGAPGSDGGSGEGTDFGVEVEDAGVGFGEEDEDAGGEEHGDDGADCLRVPLEVWGGAEEEADAEVDDEVGGLGGGAGGNCAADEVEFLGGVQVDALAGGDAAEDELGGFGGGGEGGDVGGAGALDGEGGEEEAEDDGEDGEADGEVVLEAEDDAGEDDGEEERDAPLPGFDLLLGGEGVLSEAFGGVFEGLGFLEEGGGFAEAFEEGFDPAADAFEAGFEGVPDHLVLDTELGKGGTDHDHDTCGMLVLVARIRVGN